MCIRDSNRSLLCCVDSSELQRFVSITLDVVNWQWNQSNEIDENVVRQQCSACRSAEVSHLIKQHIESLRISKGSAEVFYVLFYICVHVVKSI